MTSIVDDFKRVGSGKFVCFRSSYFPTLSHIPAGCYLAVCAGPADADESHSRALQFAKLLENEILRRFPCSFSRPMGEPVSSVVTEAGSVFGYCQTPHKDLQKCYETGKAVEESLRTAVDEALRTPPARSQAPVEEPAPLAPERVRLTFVLQSVTTGGECLNTAFGQPGDQTIEVDLPVETLGIEPSHVADKILSRLLGQFARGGLRFVLVPVAPASDAGQPELEDG